MPQIADVFDLKGRTVRNRVVMPGMTSKWADPRGLVTPRLLNHYARKAAGGPGLVIAEAAYVDPSGIGYFHHLAIDRDETIPGLMKLALRIREHGAVPIIQLTHSGRQTYVLSVAKSASAIPSRISQVPTEALTTAEIALLTDRFADAARRAVQAGFDGVEVHGAHGYLLDQFVSPLTNRRTDRYGGGLEGRLRFPLEVIRAVRAAVSDAAIVSYRLTADDALPGGFCCDEACRFARALDQAGVDLVDVSALVWESRFNDEIRRQHRGRHGVWVHLGAAIRKVVSVPVVVDGKLDEPAAARRALEEGLVDFVAVGRGILADDEWPRKVLEGRDADIVRCLYCESCEYFKNDCPI